MSSWGIFLRGMLMGAADIVPGVSGGTIAFITGIYDRLLSSIKSVDLEFAAKLLKRDIAGAWQHIDGRFLLALLLGIATSILSLARLVSWVLEHHPVPLWAFFFGLILASALVLLREVGDWLVSTDPATRLRYPVRDGIPVMLVEESEEMGQEEWERAIQDEGADE